MMRLLIPLLTLALAQDPDTSPNLKAPEGTPPEAVEAVERGKALLDEYKKDYKDRTKLEGAVEEFKKAERLAKGPFALASYHLGIVYQHTEQFKEAKRKLERAVDLNPNFHEAFLELGDTFSWMKSYDAAIKTYDKALALKPDYADAIRNKGMAHMRKSEWSEAQAFINKALEIKPDDAFGKSLKKIVDKEVSGPGFATDFKKETKHFVVVTNVDDKFTDWIATSIERIYGKYETVFPKQTKSKEKYRVIVFNTVKEYMDYGSPANTGGYYQDLTKKLVFWKQPKDSDTLLVLQHEAFHQFLAYYLDRAPQWFNEGHGDYFGPCLYNEKTRQLDVKTNPWRLRTIQQAIQAGRTTPFPQIMRMTQQELYDPKTIGINYAQSWAMVYFFWHFENGKYAKLLQEYFRALMKGDDLFEAYDAAFGKADMGKIEEEWKTFTRGLREGQ